MSDFLEKAEYIRAEVEIIIIDSNDVIVTSNVDYDGWTDI